MGQEKRQTKRTPIVHDGMIYGMDGTPIVACELRNVSATGAQIALAKEMEVPRSFLLALSHNGEVRRKCSVAWQFSIMIGVRFL
jgi:hypothetical protein